MNNPIVRSILALVPPLQAYCAEHRHMVTFTSLLMTAFIFFKSALSSLAARQTTALAEETAFYIGRETLRRYLNKSYYWHISPSSQEVIHKFYGRTSLTQFMVALLMVSSNFLCCLALFTSLFLFEPQLTMAVVAVFSLGSLGTFIFFRHGLDAAGQRNHNLNLAESSDRLTLTQGLREVLIYRRQNVFFEKMTARMAEGKPVRAFLAFAVYLPPHILEVLGFSTISILTVILIVRGVPMPEIVSAASMLMLTAWRVLPIVNRTLNFSIAIRSLRPTAISCLELLETFIVEEPEPLPAPDPNFRFERVLTLENISFSYPGSREDALSGLSLSLERGRSVGLVGPSGAGKSTLALLLTGLVPPKSGRFLVDGRELSPAGLAAYIRQVGFVPQNPLLLPGTVADNVAFSRWGEKYDREAVKKACKQAAMDFVLQHPQGINRPVSAGGQGLSGGQAQRVAIARALFTQPKLLIFDEATSALDQASEKLIAETIRKLPREITVIIIAHRLSTVEHCDTLVWLEKGKVKAVGPPAEILPRYQACMEAKAV
jgi:ABC-type multidrug transport system fused ATPase/permease subunit